MKGGRKSRNHNVPTETIVTEEVKNVPDVTEEVTSVTEEGCLNVTNECYKFKNTISTHKKQLGPVDICL